MLDVYFYEAFEEEEQALKNYLPPRISAGFTWKTIQEQNDMIAPAKIISIRTQCHLPVEWAGQVDAILSRSTGFDHLQRFRSNVNEPIALGYIPLYCSRAVAEQAMLLWMSLLRKLPRQIQQFRTFERDGVTGWECQNKKLLVVGVGNIGSEIVKIGQGLGMQVMGVDLIQKYSFVDYYSIPQARTEADIIVCAMNLTTQNRNYFNYDFFKYCKFGIIFVNIARGEMSPSVDLLKLINEGYISGLGMDVYNKESELAVALRSGKEIDDPEIQSTLELASKENVIFTPHNAFNSAEAVVRKAEQSIKQIQSFLENGQFLWSVPLEK